MFSSTATTCSSLDFYRSKDAVLGTATVVANGDAIGALSFYGAQQTGTFATQNLAAQVLVEVDGTVTSGAGADMPGRIKLMTTADASGTPTERYRITSAGRHIFAVGAVTSAQQTVGTFTPGMQLMAANQDNATFMIGNWTADANGPRLAFFKSRNATLGSHTVATTGDSLGEINFYASDGTDSDGSSAYIRAFADGTGGSNDLPGRLEFGTTADAANTPTTRMLIKQTGEIYVAGNFLIGQNTTTTPGVGNTTAGCSLGPDILCVSHAAGFCPMFVNRNEDSSVVEYYRSGTKVGSVSVTTSATAYNTSSDIRLKEDLKDYDPSDFFDRVKVHDFRWKSSQKRQIGLIGQHLIEIEPQAVFVGSDGEFMIDYSKMVPHLIQEVQNLRRQVKQLENAGKI
jgi:hypothetical protein